jgi:diguanylate cyclase (GGDEF)-like protein
VQDITNQKLLEKRLQQQKEMMTHLAHHDTLTKLPNRTLFYDRLAQAIYKAKRDDGEFALLFIDLDHFKEINDAMGHDVGDEVLKEVSQRFASTIRQEDTLARLGGDEFTILMEKLDYGTNASVLAQKILETLKKPIIIESNQFYLSCSIGISLFPSDGKNMQDLLKYADAAMYRAKEEGRSNFQFYSAEMTTLAFERVVMETSIRQGLENGEFELYYQPQVNAKENRLIGMEALVRWNHPEMGLVLPSKFIPLAEITGLIVRLDRYLMKSAISQLVEWYDKGYSPGVLALNLSIEQLRQSDFIDFIQELLASTACKAEWLEFEVTESQIMSDVQEAVKVLTELSKLGATIAIDDFGTGYSSLSYLKKLPINKLKIDKSFVEDLPEDEDDVAITQAVIALAKSLKLDLIAEGVENRAQRDFIVENGCENIQGYYYAKPLKKEDFELFLQEGILRD